VWGLNNNKKSLPTRFRLIKPANLSLAIHFKKRLSFAHLSTMLKSIRTCILICAVLSITRFCVLADVAPGVYSIQSLVYHTFLDEDQTNHIPVGWEKNDQLNQLWRIIEIAQSDHGPTIYTIQNLDGSKDYLNNSPGKIMTSANNDNRWYLLPIGPNIAIVSAKDEQSALQMEEYNGAFTIKIAQRDGDPRQRWIFDRRF
jgi:hypothetical protein